MVRNNLDHYLFTEHLETPDLTAEAGVNPCSTAPAVKPQQGDRLYLHYSSYDEDGATNSHEFKETALAAYEQAIQLAPHEAILHYHKGHLLEQLGRNTEAVTAFEEASRLGYQRLLGGVDGRGGKAGVDSRPWGSRV